MKAWAAVLVIFILALRLAACADTTTREQRFANMQRLAEKGDAGAQYNLGSMHEQGYGVTPDIGGGGLVRESRGERGGQRPISPRFPVLPWPGSAERSGAGRRMV